MPNLLSCQQSASLIGMSKSTVKRLCDKGALRSVRTPGGHRRIQLTELRHWASKQGIELQVGTEPKLWNQQALTIDLVLSFLERRDSKALATHIVGEVQSGNSLSRILDELITPALWEIGNLWEQQELDPYEEHLRSRVISETFSLLRDQFDGRLNLCDSSDDTRIAIGAVVDHEQHHFSSRMIELVLRHAGWQAQSLGAILPIESLIRATQELSPQLIWVSYTHIADTEKLIAANHRLFSQLAPHQRLMIGGQALTLDIRRRMKFHFAGDSLCHLMSYVDSIGKQ